MHNVFPALGPRFLRWAIHRRAPLVMTVHNHRLFCTNGLALRDGETCELCFHRRLPWPALAYNCNDDRAKTAYHAIALAQIRSDDLYRRAVRRFIAPSPYIEAMLSRLGVPPAQRSMMLHPVLAPEEVQPDVVESDVLYVGRLSEEKGVLQLLSAAREMPDLRVLIAGEGPLAAEVSAAAHVLPNVRALGPVAYERVHALIAASRVCVVPSLCRESASMFALEAFFRGRRAVVPALREMSWLASEPFVGVPADARDLAAFCAAVRTALAMPQLSPEQCRTLRARLGMQRFVEDLGQMLSELA
jgi:glycosyltransferase involved in cell wall biosynthesis